MFCKICGTENVPQALFCENCGAKLAESVAVDSVEITAVEADVDYAEEVEEEICEYEEEPPKKSKAVKTLIILIIVLAMLIGVVVGFVVIGNNGANFIGISNESSSSSQQSDNKGEDDKDKEDEEETDEDQKECESLVEDIMKAAENETPSVVEEHLRFECGDSKTLAEKMAKTIADEFDCDYEDLTEVCEKVTKEYFDSMEHRIKETEELSGDYLITVSFTRLDKEKILKNVLDFDADGFIEKLEKESDEELSEKEIEEALVEKIVKIINDEMSDAELIKDDLEFLVANDDGEWFIYTDDSDFKVMEKELTLEE